jgi:hypothetical protein
MGARKKIVRTGLSVVVFCSFLLADEFQWSWTDQQIVSRTDPSVGNTSKLTEVQRTAVLDLIVSRLQKPMSDQGYDDDRIREIASTTRMRLVDLGDEGKRTMFAASIGLEGGCDGVGNCPLWVFRHSDGGEYIPVLDAVAASYTVQPTSSHGFSDLVTLRRSSPTAGTLTLYQYNDGKYVDSGCFTATWPPLKEGESQGTPEVAPCKADQAK